MIVRTARRLLAVALGAALSAGLLAAVPGAAAAPANDPFYQPPAGFESTPPGTLLRSRTVLVTGLGVPFPVNAWQTLARSTDTAGRAVAVVSTLMVPRTPFLGGPRPL